MREPSPAPDKGAAVRDLDDLTVTLKVFPEPPTSVGTPLNLTIIVLAKKDLTLEFSSSNRFDLEVSDESGNVWSSSESKAYAQVLGEEKIDVGESVQYGDVWVPTAPGAFHVTGRITTTTRDDLIVERDLRVDP